MNLNEVLSQLATDHNLNADELIAYAAEDTIGGRDTAFHRQPSDWAGMSTFSDEGKLLYALIRTLKPQQVVEIGVDSGGTSTHILTALEANGSGQLYSVDIKAEVGSAVPDALRHRWTLVHGDGLEAALPAVADFCFEDGDHHYGFTHAVLLRLKALNPQVILSHDYYTHETYGPDFQVKQAFDEVLPSGKGIKIDGAFTGLGIWWNPDYIPAGIMLGRELSEHEADAIRVAWEQTGEPEPTDDVIDVQDVTPKPKARRKASRK